MIIDPRITRLAANLADYSTALKAGAQVLIDAFDVPDAIVIALLRAARARRRGDAAATNASLTPPA